MAGAAAARYHTNREWREYESDAARRSAERVAARELRRRTQLDSQTGAEAGRKVRSGGSSAAAAAAAVPTVRPAGRPAERPALRLVPRSKKKSRGMLVPLLLIGFAFLACGGAAPILLNMAAFHYTAGAVALEKQVSSLRAEEAEYNTQAAALGSTARLQEKAEQLGLQHVSGVAYIEVPGVEGESPADNAVALPSEPAAGAVTLAGVGAIADASGESRDSSSATVTPGYSGDVATGEEARTP